MRKIAFWATALSFIYIVMYQALGLDKPQDIKAKRIEPEMTYQGRSVNIDDYQRDYGEFDNRHPYNQYTFGTYAEYFNHVSPGQLKGDVSSWNPDAIKALMMRTSLYQSMMDPSVGVYTEGNLTFPSVISFIDKIHGKNEVIGQLMVSKPFDERSPKYAREYMERFRQDLLRQGYVMMEASTFAKNPLQGAGFDSNNLYTDEKQQAYELIFEKYAGVVSKGKYPLVGYDKVVLTLNPEISNDKLSYKTLSIFYTRQKFHN